MLARSLKSLARMVSGIPIEVHHATHSMAVVARLPGVRFENVDIRLSRDALTIGAEFPEGTRTVALPFAFPVDDRRAQMRFADGVLWMYLPKLPRR